MAQVINTNSLSLMAQTNLNKSQASLGTAIQRLSSGLRINSAKDDAAGQAITNRFTANIEGMTQAARNANDGISLAQTTEGALNEINDNLLNIRRLSEQALNGTNSESDKKSIQEEVTARLAEIGRIAKDTEFNGVNVLDGSTSSLQIQIGAKDGQTIGIDLPAMDLEKLGLDDYSVMNALNGKYDKPTLEASGASVASDATIGAGTADEITLDAAAMGLISTAVGAGAVADLELYSTTDKDGKTQYIAYDKVNDKATEINMVSDGAGAGAGVLDSVTAGKVLSAVDSDILRSGPSTLKGELQTYGEGKEITLPSGNKHTLQAADLEAIATELGGDASSVANMEVIGLADKNGDVSYYAVHTDATTGKQTGIAMDLDDAGGTFTAAKTDDLSIKDLQKMEELNSGNGILKTMDAALAQVDSFRSGLGAVQNRFNSIISNLNTTVNNMTEAKSRILDADFSSEVSAMSRANILQSAGITVLSQANQVPQNVLQLLR
ncbi:flagellin [Erwinia sp. V90_4]|uniref:flagellin N-terminal helical domain-containing protein n=1 Tax=Erwinia sp. V90_4 TaxID=3044239 RepID=UPI00249F8221|nr:flagellin [Erwinia sp. V90_4]MDI3439571.1 flagellin [Erwinia sp. V90_4]